MLSSLKSLNEFNHSLTLRSEKSRFLNHQLHEFCVTKLNALVYRSYCRRLHRLCQPAAFRTSIRFSERFGTPARRWAIPNFWLRILPDKRPLHSHIPNPSSTAVLTETSLPEMTATLASEVTEEVTEVVLPTALPTLPLEEPVTATVLRCIWLDLIWRVGNHRVLPVLTNRDRIRTQSGHRAPGLYDNLNSSSDVANKPPQIQHQPSILNPAVQANLTVSARY
jgi:hypothetical protein